MMGIFKNHTGKSGRQLARTIPVPVFAVLLAALVWLLLSGYYTAFLHPRFQPFLIFGAVIVAGFIMALLWGRPAPALAGPGEMLVRGAVLVVPLIFLYTAYGQGMGGHALSKKYTGKELDIPYTFTDDPPPEEREAGDANVERSLLEINRQIDILGGQRVLTEGFVYTDANVPSDHLLLFRFAIFCCAADAIPVWVFVKKEGVGTFEPDSWVKVEGVFEVGSINGKTVPMILADTVTRLAPPAPGARYLYF